MDDLRLSASSTLSDERFAYANDSGVLLGVARVPTAAPLLSWTTMDSHEPAMRGADRFRFEPMEREPTSGSRFDPA
jgi:hypothetical protein